MKKIFLLLLLVTSTLICSAQYVINGKLRVKSGTLFNEVLYGADTMKFGWRSSGFELRYSNGVRWATFTKADSSITVYNKFILESPNNDTLLSVRGGMNVLNGSVLFAGTTGATPASGEGTRMMWIPSKSAFRAGYIDDVQWDDANVGDVSFAVNEGTIASGNSSFASGTYTIASGISSTAMGGVSISRGNNSVAIGTEVISNSAKLTSFGWYNDTTISTDLVNWVLTDPLFQVGNGLDNNLRNDAFRILKNGKTYIGDMSNVTDPILTVDPTDSTSKFVGDVIMGGDIKINQVDSVVIDTANALRLYGNATVFEDLRIDATSTPTNSDEPALTSGFAGSSALLQRQFQGSVRDDKIYFNVQLPHAWKEGGYLEAHIHTSPWTTPSAGDTAVWQLNYSFQNINGTFTSPTTATVKQPLNGTAQWGHKLVHLVNFNTSGKTISSVMVCSIYRLANSSASDTYTGGMTILYIDFHYEVDALGSSNELIK